MISTQQFTNNGKYLMIALDHRGSFKKLASSPGHEATDEDIIHLKQQIIASGYDISTGSLIDPDHGLKAYKQYCKGKDITSPKPYLLCMEKSGYTDKDEERLTELEYSAKQLIDMGAQGAKLLVYYHPSAATSQKQLETARKVLDDCTTHNLPLFLEIVTYPIKGDSRGKAELVTTSIRQFLDAGIHADVFKLEYPQEESACSAITQMLGETPWILLTQGDPYDQFVHNLKIAVKNGCKGFLAGRSVWKEFNEITNEERDKFFATTAANRFREISQITLI